MSTNRFIATVSGICAAVIAVAGGVAMWLLPDLPDPVATHFGPDLAADGFGSPAGFIAWTAGTAAVLTAAYAVLASRGSAGGVTRGAAGFLTGTVVLLSSLLVTTLAPQAGLADAAGFRLPVWGIAVPFIAAIAGGILMASVLKPPPAADDSVPAAEPVAVSGSTRAVWFGRAHSPWPVLLAVGVAVVAVAASAVVTIRDGSTASAIVLGVILLLMAVLWAVMLSVRVRVDAKGIHWRFLPGIPRGSLGYDSIRAVEAVQIRPLDWGGWGYRISGKGTAILLRGGEGLRIERAKGADLYVTVDDAARGAALAQGFLYRS